jgi:hypothetical protein
MLFPPSKLFPLSMFWRTMMCVRELSCILTAIILAGCTTTPELTPAMLQAMSNTDELCQLFHTVHASQTRLPNDTASKNMAAIRAELIRRGATTQSEWELTDAGKIQIGMHKCIVFALFGAPVATTVSGNITTYGFSPSDAVSFVNGSVTTFTVANPR